MSAGHHRHHAHTPELIAEYHKLVKDPRIKAYLARPYRVDTSHPMPLTGGSTTDGRVYFADPRLAKSDLLVFVLWHERTEKAFRAVLGMAYARAHALATVGERSKVEESGRSWPAYKREVASVVRRSEHERPAAMPKGYDYGPLRESGGVKSLAWLRRRAA
jgi:hypothetical protein